jgi:hypothetical protein
MPQFNVDFSEVKELKAQAPGVYNVVVDSVDLTQSSTSGDPMLKVVYLIDGGEEDGTKLFDNLMLVGGALWRTKQAFKVLMGDDAGGDIDTDDLIGAQATVKVVNEIWAEEDGGDGSTRARISKYIPPKAPSASGQFNF